MEHQEAKHILELYRPGSAEDALDPLITEALVQLETDPELKAWFREQQALDARIGELYNAIEPPADLKTSILAGMRAHALQAEVGERGAVEFESGAGSMSQAWWRKPWVGVAAAVALLFVMFAVPRDNAPHPLATTNGPVLQAGVPDMIQFLARELSNSGERGGFEMASGQPEDLQAYLAGGGFPSPSKLPRALEGNASLGCLTLDYNGTQMSMICFQYDQVVHLITVRKSDCPRSFQPQEPTFYELNNQAFKAWTDGDLVYILSTKGSKEKLPPVI